MAEENNIATAKVTVESSRTSGSVNQTTAMTGSQEIVKLLRDIRTQLEKTGRLKDKDSKLSLGGVAGLGMLARTAGGAGGWAAAGGAIGTGLGNLVGEGQKTIERMGFGNSRFMRAIVDGEQKILEVNNETGKIKDILSEKEASDREILNENGYILSGLKLRDELQKRIASRLEKTRGLIDASSEQLEHHYTEQLRQTAIEKDITKAKKEYLEQQRRRARMGGSTRDYGQITSDRFGRDNSSRTGVGNNPLTNIIADDISNRAAEQEARRRAENIMRRIKPINLFVGSSVRGR